MSKKEHPVSDAPPSPVAPAPGGPHEPTHEDLRLESEFELAERVAASAEEELLDGTDETRRTAVFAYGDARERLGYLDALIQSRERFRAGES